MRSRYRVCDPDLAHFVTATIVDWLPVFTSAACCDIVVGSIEHCRRRKGLLVYAWVILDSHFHAVLEAPQLPDVMRDLKSYTAREILRQVGAEGREWLLDRLRFRRAAHKPTEHQVWQEGVHPQEIRGDAMMRQKLDYIHMNPVKRGLVCEPEHWRYSSAHEWLAGALPVMRCDEWM